LNSTEAMRLVRFMVAPLRRRVLLMIGRGVVKRVDDALKLQGLQLALLADEVRDDVEHFLPYGFTAHPFEGAEALVASVGGDRSHPIAVVVTDRRHRPKDLDEGEVALYTDEGLQIHMVRGGEVIVGTDATDYVALSQKVLDELTTAKENADAVLTYAKGIATAIQAGVAVPQDGGSGLKSTIVAALPVAPALTGPASVAAEKVKAK